MDRTSNDQNKVCFNIHKSEAFLSHLYRGNIDEISCLVNTLGSAILYAHTSEHVHYCHTKEIGVLVLL